MEWNVAASGPEEARDVQSAYHAMVPDSARLASVISKKSKSSTQSVRFGRMLKVQPVELSTLVDVDDDDFETKLVVIDRLVKYVVSVAMVDAILDVGVIIIDRISDCWLLVLGRPSSSDPFPSAEVNLFVMLGIVAAVNLEFGFIPSHLIADKVLLNTSAVFVLPDLSTSDPLLDTSKVVKCALLLVIDKQAECVHVAALASPLSVRAAAVLFRDSLSGSVFSGNAVAAAVVFVFLSIVASAFSLWMAPIEVLPALLLLPSSIIPVLTDTVFFALLLDTSRVVILSFLIIFPFNVCDVVRPDDRIVPH